MSFEIAVLVGSLRANSNSSHIANAIETVAPATLKFRRLPIGDLPIYNEDFDGDKAPAPYTSFRAGIAQADAVLFITPEYNRSVPGGLKNAIDVGSRPYGKGALIGKPAAIISSSPGPIGGFGSNHAIRQSLVFLNMPVLQQPEAYLGHIKNSFDDAGRLTSESLKNLLSNFIAAFEQLIAQSKSKEK